MSPTGVAVAQASEPIRILLVDPDYAHRDALAGRLASIGWSVREAWDIGAAMAYLGQTAFDIVVLDDDLPDGYGFDLVKAIRDVTDCGIVMMSGRADVTRRILALEMGVDDFLAKPVDLGEALARLKAVWRRYRPVVRPPINVRPLGDGHIDLVHRRVTSRTGVPAPLTPLEFALLAALFRASGRTLSREQLLDECHGDADRAQPRTVDVMIRRLRAKLAQAALSGVVIATRRGGGYALALAEAQMPTPATGLATGPQPASALRPTRLLSPT